ncbi:GspH/FimT family pseudopilin [Verminephrobacter eiseniae]|uniref:GspH/FimT family pseudopilin n=1 Tax=Verminephrobacter eiseniae TaxID=364317 RepID=UPI0022380713|nr:GspH/FimT family pseudopilin [Verminephrobacter eiseniae]MCW5235205.1 prepilin-type N-terminal cleavage/methylation domain-containing protein [Verminephrobacter eiseniae]
MIHQPPRAGAAHPSMQRLREQLPKNRLCTVARGFTLTELLMTLALAVILGSLAAPSVRDFIVRSKLTNLGNEFISSVLKARSEAVNHNTCVTLCLSSNADADAPACTSTTLPTDWHKGWILFLNPICNNGATAPDPIDMLLARPATNADYSLLAQNGKTKMTFNAHGGLVNADLEQFNLIYKSSEDPLTKRFAFNICMNGLGRTRMIPSNKTCTNYH